MRSLRFLGMELLAQPPWHPKPFRPDMDEAQWVETWSGGWQLLVPNAGARAVSVHPSQGFHGNASIEQWHAEVAGADACRLRWQSEQFSVVRDLRLTGSSVVVATQLHNRDSRPQPYIVTEHLVLGGAILANGCALDVASAASVTHLDYSGAPSGAPVTPWGSAGLRSVGPWTPARLFVLGDVGNHGVVVYTPDIVVSIRWDSLSLPFAWIWQEVAATKETPWNGSVRALGIEPSTAQHGLGLDHDLATGQTHILEPDSTLEWSVVMNLSSKGAFHE